MFETSRTETPSPLNPLGAKGIGESGAIGATPAVWNAVVDALSHLGVENIDMPATPMRVWQAIEAARSGARRGRVGRRCAGGLPRALVAKASREGEPPARRLVREPRGVRCRQSAAFATLARAREPAGPPSLGDAVWRRESHGNRTRTTRRADACASVFACRTCVRQANTARGAEAR